MANAENYKTDAIGLVYNQAYIDRFHSADPLGNERIYRHQKALVAEEFIRQNADPKKIFLDAGAGRGPYSYLAADFFGKVYCFEFDGGELEEAKKNIGHKSNIEFGQADLRSIPLPDQAVDFIICSEVLEHIPNEHLAAQELYRVLKPGGKMLFSMPNNKSMFYRRVAGINRVKEARQADQQTLSHGDWEALRHVSFSYLDIEKILTDVGFKIIDRMGANIISLPGFLRKIVLKSVILLRLFKFLHHLFARVLAKYGAFYFLVATK